MLRDLRYALRRLSRSPGFVAVAALIMGLSIGANSGNFAVANVLLFGSIPGLSNTASLVRLYQTEKGNSFGDMRYADVRGYRRASTLEGVCAWRGITVNLGLRGSVERVDSALVSANYFDILGVRPVAGRTFAAGEDRTPGQPSVAVISHGLWTRRFGAEAKALGSEIRLNGHNYTIIGVAPERFRGADLFDSLEIWAPITMYRDFKVAFPGTNLLEDDGNLISSVARLKPRADVQKAQAELQVLLERMDQARGRRKDQGRRITLVQSTLMHPEVRKDTIRAMVLGGSIAGALLLVACANLASLLLARASERRAEIGVRLALGARTRDLVRQLFAESLLLAVLGGVLALSMTSWSANLAISISGSVPFRATVDGRVLVFTFAVTLLTAVLMGLAPAIDSARMDLVSAIKGKSTGRRQGRLRDGLVVTQVAVSLGILVVCGLLIRTLRNYRSADPGFNCSRLLFAPVDLRSPGYSDARAQLYMKQIVERVRAIPGVKSASIANFPPFTGWIWTEKVRADSQELEIGKNTIGPEYFATMEMPLAEGREFTDADRPGAPLVVIINQSLARRLWAGQDALGRTIRLVSPFDQKPALVIGVAKDVTTSEPGDPPRPWIYLPILQHHESNFLLHVKTSVPPGSVREAVRREAQSSDRDVPISEVSTFEERLREALGIQRVFATSTGTFGVIALLITAIGLYGVVAYWVAQRMHDLGVRAALGARPAQIFRLVVGRGMALCGIGIVIGVLLGAVGSQVYRGYLFRIAPSDPTTYALGAALILAVGLIAAWLPARRATRVDVATLLRAE